MKTYWIVAERHVYYNYIRPHLSAVDKPFCESEEIYMWKDVPLWIHRWADQKGVDDRINLGELDPGDRLVICSLNCDNRVFAACVATRNSEDLSSCMAKALAMEDLERLEAELASPPFNDEL
jgi:hypothetical protein